MTTGCYETSFLLLANARGAETLSTAKSARPLGLTVQQMPGFALGGGGGGMLTARIDSYIIHSAKPKILKCNKVCNNVWSYRTELIFHNSFSIFQMFIPSKDK